MNGNAIEGLKRALAAVNTDLETSEAEKATLETKISMLKRERRRLETELTRELAAAGKPWANPRRQQASCSSHRWWQHRRWRRRPMQGRIMARGRLPAPAHME